MPPRERPPAMWNAIWDDRPAEYSQARDCWLNRRRSLFIREFLRGAGAGDRVVELGSGTGDLLIELAARRPDLQFLGIEPQQSYVEFSAESASRRGLANVAFRASRAEEAAAAVPPDQRFRWLLSNDTIHHLADVPAALSSAAAIAAAGARWLAIEPNWRNPYVFLGQALKRGEKNFRPAAFLNLAGRAGWSCLGRSYLFLIPPLVKHPPEAALRLESALERFSPVAGGIALTLSR